jgi:hypothetical protein
VVKKDGRETSARERRKGWENKKAEGEKRRKSCREGEGGVGNKVNGDGGQ